MYNMLVQRVYRIIKVKYKFEARNPTMMYSGDCDTYDGQFLGLLDYVSRAHSMGSLSVVRPSAVRVAIISQPNGWISFKFWWFLLRLSHTLGRFLNFEKKSFSKVCRMFCFSLT